MTDRISYEIPDQYADAITGLQEAGYGPVVQPGAPGQPWIAEFDARQQAEVEAYLLRWQEIEGTDVVLARMRAGELSPEAARNYVDAFQPAVTSRPGIPGMILIAMIVVALAFGTGIIVVSAALVPLLAIGSMIALVVYAVTQATKEARQMHRSATWASRHHSDPATRKAATGLRWLPPVLLLILLVLVLGGAGMYIMAIVGR